LPFLISHLFEAEKNGHGRKKEDSVGVRSTHFCRLVSVYGHGQLGSLIERGLICALKVPASVFSLLVFLHKKRRVMSLAFCLCNYLVAVGQTLHTDI
jgi:hypothetical protein